MTYRISPFWWPAIGAFSPVLSPFMLKKFKIYKENLGKTEYLNRGRIQTAKELNLPELEFLELTALVEEKTKTGFIGDAGVSYLLKTPIGSVLFDVGFGPERPALARNAKKIGFTLDKTDAVVISHLHPDHMGGMLASRSKNVRVPEELGLPDNKPCYLPDSSDANGFSTLVVKSPMILEGGIASTGPLARSLFFFGLTEEQALVARIKGKGLLVITGCGHPTIEVILEMVKKLSSEPVYAICGGLHFPITEGRGNKLGIQFQRFVGTGLPPWKEITDADLDKTISAINRYKPKRVCLSAHDSCDHALNRLKSELKSETEVLVTGETYRF